MKIGLFVRCLCTGGTERVTAQLSRLWSRMGHKIVLLTDWAPSESDFPHDCIARECAEDGNSWRQDEVLNLVEKHDFDLCVFSGSWNTEFFKPAVRVLKNKGVKVVTILHHVFNNWAYSCCNEGDFDKGDVLPLIDCLLCVDRMQALWWSRRHPRVVCIENPVAVEDAAYAESRNIEKGARNIVWVGRPRDVCKRVELAIDAFKLIAAKDASARLTVVGDIGDKQKNALIERLDVDTKNRVTFTGYVADTTPYLLDAAVNLVTTLLEVAVPQVVLEAQAVGLPTVALDIPVLRNCEGVDCVATVEDMAAKTVAVLNRTAEYVRHPFIDVAARNRDVSKRWEALFAAAGDNGIASFAESQQKEWRTLENAELVIDEIQRGEMFHIQKEFPRLRKLNIFKLRINRVIKYFGMSI